MNKDNLSTQETLIQVLTLAYKKGNNLTDITPQELIEELSNKLEPIMKNI
ncbi:hypothetical protein [Priestia megaterium]|nr:hypothetical protein [Priestia megaterium]